MKGQQRQLRKTALVKVEAYIVSIDRRQPYTDCKIVKLGILKITHKTLHSNTFLYFSDLPVSSSVLHFCSSRAGLHVQYDIVQVPYNALVQ